MADQLQNPVNAQAPTPDQFAHVRHNLSAVDEEEQANVIRNPNATMTRVLEGLKEPGGGAAAPPSSARELALAKLEAAIRERKVAKGKTAANQTKAGGARQSCVLELCSRSVRRPCRVMGCGSMRPSLKPAASCLRRHPAQLSINYSIFIASKLGSSEQLLSLGGACAGAPAAPVAAAGAANAGGADSDEDDQIRGPRMADRRAPFKPGTSTWDTDDAKEAARKVGKRALAEAKAVETSKKRAREGRVVPAAWWAAEYRPRFEESVETVGAASRAVTATTSEVVTRNERVQRLVHRCEPSAAWLPASACW